MVKDYIYDDQQSLFGQREVVGFGTEEFYVKEIDRNLSNDVIIKNHYSGKVTMSTLIHLGVFLIEEMVGVLQFGHAMNPASVGNVVSGTGVDEYLELNRMWLDDKAGKNSESRAISYSIKYIKRKYPKIKWIQSFADERCGLLGIVYQACSFNFYGMHKNIFWELDGEYYHNKAMTIIDPSKSTPKEKNLQKNKHRAIPHELRQFRYIKFIDQRCKKDCLLEERPYPKYYNGD